MHPRILDGLRAALPSLDLLLPLLLLSLLLLSCAAAPAVAATEPSAAAAAAAAAASPASLSSIHHLLRQRDPNTRFQTSVHTVQLHAGQLLISQRMMRQAKEHLEFNATAHEPLQEKLFLSFRNQVAEHRRESGPPSSPSPPRRPPPLPHRMFTRAFFIESTQAIMQHQPRVLPSISLQGTQGTAAQTLQPPVVSLHIPTKHTLQVMQSYFHAHGSHVAESLAHLYGHPEDEEALHVSSVLSTHPRFHYQWLIHLKWPVTEWAVRQVEAIIRPYKLDNYLPHASFLLSLPYELALKLQQSGGPVLFVCMLDAPMKLQIRLQSKLSRKMKVKLTARSLSLSHEIRMQFTHPLFAASIDDIFAVRHRFPADRADLLLTRPFCDRAVNFWNRHARFLQANGSADSTPFAGLSNSALIEFRAIDSRQVLIRLPAWLDPEDSDQGESFFAYFLSKLSHHPLVQYVEARAVMRPFNKHAKVIMQSEFAMSRGCADSGASGSPLSSLSSRPRRRTSGYAVPHSAEDDLNSPLSSLLRLDGCGSILTISDTGVDHDSCFFHDVDHPVTMNNLTPDMAHRKIAGYHTARVSEGETTRAPAGDDEGHGTHTAGSLAGAVSDSCAPFDFDNYTQSALGQYNGLCPAARLLIFDFQNHGDTLLYVPDAIGPELLDISYGAFGSRIGSNSWGDESDGYNSFALDIDQWLSAHEDYLFVIAAGNSGSSGSSTIASPAVAKNVLTIGASRNSVCSFFEQGKAIGFNIIKPSQFINSFSLCPASFGAPLHRFRPQPLAGDFDLRVCYADPVHACTPLLNSLSCTGAVLFVERGTCSFTLKALHTQDAGAVAMILLNNDADPNFIMDPDRDSTISHSITIALGSINISAAAQLRPVLQSNDAAAGVRSLRVELPTFQPTLSQSEHSLSAFSSKGPTFDGRLKPEVLAPGESIESANADQDLQSFQCAQAMVVPPIGTPSSASRTFSKLNVIAAKEGTSMACPLAAAAANMVRQYFTAGHYKEPTSGTAFSFSPSAALLKAVLVSGASAVSGFTSLSAGDVQPVEAPPSNHQGFGRIQLDGSLAYSVEGEFSPNGHPVISKYKMFVRDRAMIQTGQLHSYCFRIRDSAAVAPSPVVDFKATLVWTDPAPLILSGGMLVNNLDLSIVGFTSEESLHRVVIGNAKPPNSLTFDSANNVEKAIESHPVPGSLYTVNVRGTHVPVPLRSDSELGQPYALVVNGDFDVVEGEDCPQEAMCLGSCSGHGRCLLFLSGSNSTVASNNGVCHCEAPWAGSDCSDAIVSLQPVNASLSEAVVTRNVSVAVHRWVYLSYQVRSGDRFVDWSFHRSSSAGDPDFYFSVPGKPDSTALNYPSLYSFAYSNTDCEPCQPVNSPLSAHTQHMAALDLFAPDDLIFQHGGAFIVLGVWGHCCGPSDVEITLTVRR